MSTADWHILGAGAIGGLFATRLARAGADCQLLLRDAQQERCTLSIEENGTVEQVSLRCGPVDDGAPIARLLVTTKAHQALAALASVQQRLDRDASVVLMINGMGLAEEIRQRLPGSRIYCGTTTEGAYRRSRRHIVHAGRGSTLLGSPVGAPKPEWFRLWEIADLDCRWTDDIDAALWHKLAINCAINPLTALHRCRNGELVADPDLHRAMNALCDEIAAVSRQLGYEDTANELHAVAAQVAAATASNRSSMLQDVAAGQPTEIDYITGYLVARAGALGLSVPRNRALLEAIKHA